MYVSVLVEFSVESVLLRLEGHGLQGAISGELTNQRALLLVLAAVMPQTLSSSTVSSNESHCSLDGSEPTSGKSSASRRRPAYLDGGANMT